MYAEVWRALVEFRQGFIIVCVWCFWIRVGALFFFFFLAVCAHRVYFGIPVWDLLYVK